MKRWAALLIAAGIAFCGSGAFCESGTSEIEKIAGLASWLLDEVQQVQQEMREQQLALDAMLFMYQEGDSVSPEEVQEAAAALTRLGIGGITQEHVRRMTDAAADAQTYGYVFTRELAVLNLLCMVGMGTYDDDFVWRPSSDDVFALDMELFGGETLYGDFFRGLNALCDGEFAFSDLVEDYAQADLAEGEGVIGLSFMVNGEQHALSAEMMQDWFDADVFNAAAEIAVHEESGRRLYAVYDGTQVLIMFYRTPEWARQFTEATGCPLFETLPSSF